MSTIYGLPITSAPGRARKTHTQLQLHAPYKQSIGRPICDQTLQLGGVSKSQAPLPGCAGQHIPPTGLLYATQSDLRTQCPPAIQRNALFAVLQDMEGRGGYTAQRAGKTRSSILLTRAD